MARVRPFHGLRARDDLAARVIAPPYDVPTEAEARAIAEAEPMSFLHVTRPDVDLPLGADLHAPEAYQTARAALDRFRAQGWLQQDAAPGYYLYQQTWQGRSQTGLIALVSAREYVEGRIKKHELTRPDKEQDRVDHIEALDAQTGLVFLAWRAGLLIEERLRGLASQGPAAWEVETEDGVHHRLVPVFDPGEVRAIEEAFLAVPALYIADGHHRAAAAARVAAARVEEEESAWFIAGLFPHTDLRILPYNRLVHDLGGLDPAALEAALDRDFSRVATSNARPPERGSFTCYLGGRWQLLRPRLVPTDPVGRLDVAVLQDRVLGPLLGITDPRRDTRISFVGGIRGEAVLAEAVDRGEAAVAFCMYPTGMDQLLDVADAGLQMPPKSTWFEPKLRSGGVAHLLRT